MGAKYLNHIGVHGGQTMNRPTYLTPTALARWIPELVSQNRLWVFYKTPEWTDLRRRVLDSAHNECEDCKKKSPSVIEKATCVHHEREVVKYPELALATFYVENGKKKQQLHALCDRCHNARHERFGHEKKEQLNEEKW